MSNVSLTRNIREIKDKIAAEHNERLELEKKNWQLELALNNIKEALEEVRFFFLFFFFFFFEKKKREGEKGRKGGREEGRKGEEKLAQ